MNFKDHFSKQSDIYARFRPQYPDELFAYLASLTNEHELAWDCGTGNGQAAVGLAAYYKKVIATDPSKQQLSYATPHPKIEYRNERSEKSSLTDSSADLITVANALHWFSFDEFYNEVKRVLKPGGIFAAWAYGIPEISPEIDRVVDHFHHHTVDKYWLPENRLVQNRYRDLYFPFQEIESPRFYTEKEFNLDDLINFLRTWSATQTFIREEGIDPTDQVRKELSPFWHADAEKTVRWQLVLKAVRV